MISKVELQAQIDKLRIIHLYEANYNGLLKLNGRSAQQKNATKKDLLNHSQGGGGQKGRQAYHIMLQKEMKYMYARLRKHGHHGQ
jgi:hypothetical protein